MLFGVLLLLLSLCAPLEVYTRAFITERSNIFWGLVSPSQQFPPNTMAQALLLELILYLIQTKGFNIFL